MLFLNCISHRNQSYSCLIKEYWYNSIYITAFYTSVVLVVAAVARGRKNVQMRQIYLEMVWQEERKIGYHER
jgi:hypothetical protein